MKKSFALIYVLVFTSMILVFIIAISENLVVNLRLQRSSHSSIQAYNLARGAIDRAWEGYISKLPPANNIKIEPFSNDNQIYTDPKYIEYLKKTFPDNTSCDYVTRVNLNTNRPSPPIRYDTALPTDPNNDGIYDYRVCYKGTDKYIETRGYFRGARVVLRADIAHYSNIAGVPTPKDFFEAKIRNGLVTLIDMPFPLEDIEVCNSHAPKESCSNDPAKIRPVGTLETCEAIAARNPALCISSGKLPKLSDITFNHSFDILKISQVSP